MGNFVVAAFFLLLLLLMVFFYSYSIWLRIYAVYRMNESNVWKIQSDSSFCKCAHIYDRPRCTWDKLVKRLESNELWPTRTWLRHTDSIRSEGGMNYYLIAMRLAIHLTNTSLLIQFSSFQKRFSILFSSSQNIRTLKRTYGVSFSSSFSVYCDVFFLFLFWIKKQFFVFAFSCFAINFFKFSQHFNCVYFVRNRLTYTFRIKY